MNNLSELVLQEIKKQYKSVRRFAEEMGIPQTTIVSALKNGIGGTAYDTVVKICEKLNIELINYNSHIVMTDDVIDLINMYNNLDEKGAHAVMAFAAMEFNRSKGNDDYIIQAIAKSNEITERKTLEPALPEIVTGY